MHTFAWRRGAALVLGAFCALSSLTAIAPPASAITSDVVVAVVDTGVRATHQEFTYAGPSSTTDQFVAWWDFSDDAANHLPGPGDTWDTTTPDPFDPVGHGTSTASLAVGDNVAPSAQKQPSFAPGAKLAVAKVGDASGAVSGDLAAAIRWSAETVRADIISMSIGEIAPLPALISADVQRAIRDARANGVLVVVSNGNGFANAGIPGDPGFASGYGNSPHALGVGASGLDGTLVTTDPEVTARFFDVPAAVNTCDTCYSKVTGTSFSAPLVAGFGAKLKQVALAAGGSPSADYLERLVKYSARDTTLPPTFEGYGVIDAAQLAAATTHATNGTLPSRPSPDVNGLYVETVQGTLDSAWTEKAADGLQQLTRTFIGATTPSSTIGASAPLGLSEAEVWELTVPAGQTVTVDLAYGAPDSVADVDLYVLRSPGPSFSGVDVVARSANGAGIDEHAEFFSAFGGTYSVVALGWSVATPQPITVTSNATLAFNYQDYVLHTFGASVT